MAQVLVPLARGRDMGIRLTVTLAEAAAGVTKTLAYDRLAPVTTAAAPGQPRVATTHLRSLPRHRSRHRGQRTIFGQMQTQTTCPVCHGSGKVVDKPCETCEGPGSHSLA